MLPADRRSPAVSRLPLDRPGRDAIIAAHETALDSGSAGYIDPETGFFVFTAAYLWSRGRCCETGCRHCPYVEPRH